MQTTIYLTIASENLRSILTIYFTVFSTLICVVGEKCLSSKNRRTLLNDRTIPLSHMTSWLTSFAPFIYLIRSSRIPGGWLGLIMLITTVISPICHLLVSKFVRTVTLTGQCAFGTGVVMTQNTSFFADHRSSAVSVWPPARIAIDAQSTSARNGGLPGIYWKANEDPMFRAGPDDVAGQWGCVELGQEESYAAGTTFTDVASDLQSKNLQYADPNWYYWLRPHGDDIGLLVWSPSVGDDVEEPWDVKVSINTDMSPKSVMHMKSFHCSMTGPRIQFVLANINSLTTLTGWAGTLYGALGIANRSADTMVPAIQTTLNSIVLVSGSGNGASHPPAPGASPTQGCLQPRSALPVQVSVMLVVVTALVILLATYWLLIVRWSPSEPSMRSLDERIIPDSVLGWQAQAIREKLRSSDGPKVLGVKWWQYGYRTETEDLGLIQMMGHSPAMELT